VGWIVGSGWRYTDTQATLGANKGELVGDSKRKAIIVWCAIAGALTTFAAISTVLGPNFRPDHQEVRYIAVVSAGVAVLLVAISRLLPQRMKVQDPVPGSAAMTRTIISAALCEGGGTFGCIAWMLTGDPWAVVAIAFAFAGLLLAFPTERRWRELSGEGAHEAPPAQPNRLVR
jgi:hypothetical protein